MLLVVEWQALHILGKHSATEFPFTLFFILLSSLTKWPRLTSNWSPPVWVNTLFSSNARHWHCNVTIVRLFLALDISSANKLKLLKLLLFSHDLTYKAFSMQYQSNWFSLFSKPIKLTSGKKRKGHKTENLLLTESSVAEDGQPSHNWCRTGILVRSYTFLFTYKKERTQFKKDYVR